MQLWKRRSATATGEVELMVLPAGRGGGVLAHRLAALALRVR